MFANLLSKFPYVLLCFSLSVFAQPENHYEKALQSFNLKKSNETLIHLKNSLKANPEHLPSKILLAQVYLKAKNANATIDLLKEAMAFGADPNLTTILLMKAHMLNRDYQKVIDQNNDNLNKKNKFELILLQASALKSLDRLEESLVKYEQALSLKPSNRDVITDLAYFFLQQEKLNRVYALVAQLLSIDPDSARTTHLQGLVFQKENKTEEALKAFEKAYKNDITDPYIARSLVNMYIQAKDFPNARIIMDDILKETPNEPFIMLLNARLHTINNDNALANQAYDDIMAKLSVIPSETLDQLPELRYVTGLTAYMLGQYEQAQKNLLTFLTQDKDKLRAIKLLVDIFIKQETPERAIRLLEQHELIVLEDLPLSLAFCNLYNDANKSYKCQFMIDELRMIHGDHTELELLQVKTFQTQKLYSRALSFFELHFEHNTDEKILHISAILYYQNNLENKAIDKVNALLALDKESVRYKILKSEILLKYKHIEEAETLINKMLIEQPNLFNVKFNLARLHFLKAEYYEAQKISEKLINNETRSLRLYLLLGNTFYEQKKFVEALDYFQKAMTLAGNNPIPHEQIIKTYRLMKNPEKAVTELERLSKKHLLVPKYIQLKAEIYLELKQFEKVKREYLLLYSLWSNDVRKLLYLGQLQRIANFYDDAEITLDQALTLAPKFIFAQIELLRLYIAQEQIVKAEQLIKPLLVTNPKNANLQLLSGDIASSRNNAPLAQKYYLHALKYNYNYQLAAIKLFNLAKDENIGRESFETLMLVIINKHPDSHFHRFLYANYLLSIGKPEQAKTHLIILEKIDNLPSLKFVYNNLANIFLEENLGLALQYIDKALEIDNVNASFFDTKGWVLSLQKNHPEGLEYLRIAYSLDSSNPSNLYHIAYTLTRLDRKAEALIELDNALELEVSFAEKEKAIKLRSSLIQ